MADAFKPCFVARCNGNAAYSGGGRRGLCGLHYKRYLKTGEPILPKSEATLRGDAQRYFRDHVLSYEGDDCLVWPFFRKEDGRGMMSGGDRPILVHRQVCIEAHGPPPSDEHEAAHLCGNGHLGCVNKRHLAWKTKLENRADTKIHGTWGWKLTEPEVKEIRRLEGVVAASELADRYSVDPSLIYLIFKREIWTHL